uniref:Uncharacterized protein n=1 Tax=Rhizophora mucronata TaxID=61149 RepID=A0A2P2R1T8_RHIMU
MVALYDLGEAEHGWHACFITLIFAMGTEAETRVTHLVYEI